MTYVMKMDSNVEFEFCSIDECLDRRGIDSSEKKPLCDILPGGYNYTVCQYDITDAGITALLRLDIKTEDDAHTWLRLFQEKTFTTLRVAWKGRAAGQKNVFSVHYRCQHGSFRKCHPVSNKKSSSRTKITNCPATLAIAVKRVMKRSRSMDIHATDLPTVIRLSFTHNHPLMCAEALNYRDVSEEVTKTFKKLFEYGHSPSTALHSYKYDLQEKYGNDFMYAAADRAICPDKQWIYRLYYKIFKENYGHPDGEAMLRDLEQKVASYNTGEDVTARMVLIGKNICIALCTDLMKRIHALIKQSSELVFVDSSGEEDHHGCRVFLMRTHSAAGALPLGVLITTSEAQEVLTEGFKLLKGLFPHDAFFGRGGHGPEVIMTDDAECERNALQSVFDGSHLLLCTFHVLQAMWRYLWDAKHCIRKEHRPHLMQLVKALLYADTDEILAGHYTKLLNDEAARKYPTFMNHIKHLYQRKEEWATCFSKELPVQGSNTNNYVEAAMHILRDKIFHRTKAFNMVQLVDFLFTRVDKTYTQKLLDVANNQWKKSITSRYISTAGWALPAEKIQQISGHAFEIPSEKRDGVFYHIDMEAGVCSCAMGMTGGPCKHQHMVAKHFYVTSINSSPGTNPALRELFFEVATGAKSSSDNWFSSVHSSGTSQRREDVWVKREEASPVPFDDFNIYVATTDYEVKTEEDYFTT